MQKNLPPRPNLDHLRRQAKALLADLESKDAEAVATIQKYLPSAKGMTKAKVLSTRFRLADAQSAVARKGGFAGWPQLSRHVDQLRALEGHWAFARLEIDGIAIPAGGLEASLILIDGDRFRTESPEANYEGIFNINVESEPHEIDIEFVEGPEAGNWNYGIFRLDGDRLEICLDVNGKPRPAEFITAARSGHAYEMLTRTSQARPENVKGGTPQVRQPVPSTQPSADFEYVESPTLTRLAGEWLPVAIVRDGQDLPKMFLSTGRRSASKNEITISMGGQTMINALVRIDESADPMHVDYFNLGGMCKGTTQLGLLKWIGDEACFCMSAPGQPRPADFESPPGSGRTFSQWRRKS